MIPAEQLAEIRSRNELVAFIEAAGIKLRRHGSDYLGLCPFHADRSPSLSVSPAKQYWCCHGACSSGKKKAGGDVIEFARRLWGISFREAIDRLGGQTIDTLPPQPAKKLRIIKTKAAPPAAASQPRQIALLAEVARLYHLTLGSSPVAKEYLRSRGITNPDLIAALEIGYADGTLLERVPEGSETRSALEALGVLTPGRWELLAGCIVVPLRDLQGRVVNFYGRPIDRDGHYFLPGPRCGLVNAASVATSQEIVIAESVIDALSFMEAGVMHAVPIYGVNGWTSDHDALLEAHRIRKVIVALDNDPAGQNAAQALVHKLTSHGLDVRNAALPAKDANELLVSQGPARFAEIWHEALHPPAPQSPAPPAKDEQRREEGSKSTLSANITAPGQDQVLIFGSRTYRVRGLTALGADRMRVTIRVEQGSFFHVDLFDLYSARSRRSFADASAAALRLDEHGAQTLASELGQIIDALEQQRLAMRESERTGHGQADAQAPMSDSERAEALAMLAATDLVATIRRDVEILGCVGESDSALIAYLAALSRKTAEPLSVIFCARSGAGKSALQNTILDFLPPEDTLRFTRLTGNALFYEDENGLVNKLLAIDEEDGAADATYALRSLQSAGYLATSYTRSDPKDGKHRAEHWHVNGPTSIFFTTAHPEALDYETRNRFVILTPDESKAQTQRILERQRWSKTLDGLVAREERKAVIRRHQNAQRLLEPLRVVIPDALSLTFPSNRLIVRREQKKFLTLIETVTLLHQHQRQRKTKVLSSGERVEYIEASRDDLDIAASLAPAILRRNLDELAPPTRSLLLEIRSLTEGKNGDGLAPALIHRQDIQKATGLSYWHLRVYLQQLIECEYVRIARGHQGKRIAYELLWEGDDDDPASEVSAGRETPR